LSTTTRYIEKALNSINQQQFDGGIEIVLHDDASTDHSAEVYQRVAAGLRYPVKIIRPALNKVSRGISMWPEILAHCQGEYLAICEGDDFWLAPHKLAYQCNSLDQLAHVDLVFHSAARVNWASEQIEGAYAEYGAEPKPFSPGEVIEGDGGFIPTPTLMCRRAVFERLPAWFYDRPPVEDYFIQVYGALRGGALYLPMQGAAYRVGDPASWSQRSLANIEKANQFELHFIEYLLHMRASLPAALAPHVDVIMLRHYNLLCERCFSYRRPGDLIRLGQLFERFQAAQEGHSTS
jgi:glycosyltransferase involved in cell wall biosynthesis